MPTPRRVLGAAAITAALLSSVTAHDGGCCRRPRRWPFDRRRRWPRLPPAAVVLRLTATVVAGDSAFRIARRHGVALQDLLKVNGMSAKTVLRPGMVLRIPPIVIPAALAARLPRPLLARPERLRLVAVFQATARSVGVPADLLMALAYRESNWNAQALSRSGAMGIGQLMPSTVAYVTTRLLKSPVPLDPWDPADNIWMSGRTLAQPARPDRRRPGTGPGRVLPGLRVAHPTGDPAHRAALCRLDPGPAGQLPRRLTSPRSHLVRSDETDVTGSPGGPLRPRTYDPAARGAPR